MSTKVTLLYPPHQSWPGSLVKPNGSLAFPMLAGALLENDIEVQVVDAIVGTDKESVDEVFYKSTELPSGLYRTGLSDERILEEIADSTIVGMTSIFSDQETMVLNTARLIKKAYPDKLIIAGGVNARHRLEQFFAAGVDLVCLSEAERTIVNIVRAFEKGSRDFSDVSSISFMKNGKIVSNLTTNDDVVFDLDELPMPAWHLMPMEKYWEIGRPHGGFYLENYKPGELKYASLMTSLGCPFKCSFCHVAGEFEGSVSGPIGKFRIKSDERVMAEIALLKDLGVKQIFLEDDALFGRRNRGMNLFRKIRSENLDILDVNGVNIIHLLRKGKPDPEIIDILVEAGFKEIGLPFETANPRIMKKYISNKWDPINSDVIGLIRLCKEKGLMLSGNYMIGYPDETEEEIQNTIQMAKTHVDAGLDSAHFMCVMPLPGAPFFDMAVANNYLPDDFEVDKMQWMKANMINTTVPPERLEAIRDQAWEDVNPESYKNAKRKMVWGLDGEDAPYRAGQADG